MSYGQKIDFQDGGRRHLKFQNFQFWASWLQSGSTFAVDNFSLRYDDLTIFKMAAVRHLGFYTFAFFCPVALVIMPFCFLIQNFAEIGQSVDELWPKKRFTRWRPPLSWILKISIFVHVTVIVLNICCRVPNFIKIGWFFTEIWWFSDLQIGGSPSSWICYDVTILHRRTHFRCANIVLKSVVDRCCSFRDNCNIISQPFGCT